MGTDATMSANPPPLFSPGCVVNPYPTYRVHLAGPSVQPLAVMPGNFVVFQFAACSALLRDRRLSVAQRARSFIPVGDDRLPEFNDLYQHFRRWLLNLDAPVHTRLRKLMNAGFAPVTVERLRLEIEAVVRRLLADMETRHSVDVIEDYAYPLPVRVISRLLGIPESLENRCVQLSSDVVAWLGNPRRAAEETECAQMAVRELESIFETVIRKRDKGSSGDDLLCLLLKIAADDGAITPADLLAQCVLLLVAGHETTRNLIGNAVYTLLKYPAALDEVRTDDNAARMAVEEVLRFESPVQGFRRTVMEDIDFDGYRISAGADLFFILGAAHRDPRLVEAPDSFDIRRNHNRHLAFGGDAHVCVGATLARLEAQIAVRELARRFPSLALVNDNPEWNPTFTFRGLRRLPVTL